MKILVLTNFHSRLYLDNMLRLGAHGYLLKTARQDIFLEAVRTVYNGQIYLDPSFEPVQAPFTRVSIYNKVTLTLREKEIVQLVPNGSSNQEIVEQLYLSINTIKSYMARIFVKLDVKNRAELTKKALQLGLVK
jgi:two-component system secretion response regulator SsrB